MITEEAKITSYISIQHLKGKNYSEVYKSVCIYKAVINVTLESNFVCQAVLVTAEKWLHAGSINELPLKFSKLHVYSFCDDFQYYSLMPSSLFSFSLIIKAAG